jgi:hypothetical protein
MTKMNEKETESFFYANNYQLTRSSVGLVVGTRFGILVKIGTRFLVFRTRTRILEKKKTRTGGLTRG